MTVSNPITVTADGTGDVGIAGSSTASVMTYSGDITLGRDVNLAAFNTFSRRVEAILGGNYELVVGNAGTATFAGTIANNAGVVSFTKAGSGTQVLSGGNIYTGTTTINAGTLQVGDGGTTGTLGSAAVINNASLAK